MSQASSAAVRSAFETMDKNLKALVALPDGASPDLIGHVERSFEAAKAVHERAVARHEMDEARANLPISPVEDTHDASGVRLSIGREQQTYDRAAPNSFFADIDRAKRGDYRADERLRRHMMEMQAERRDLSSVDAAGGFLVPPAWLNDQLVELARAGRPVVNTIGTQELPPNTDSLNIPRMTSGATVALQADNAVVSEPRSTAWVGRCRPVQQQE